MIIIIHIYSSQIHHLTFARSKPGRFRRLDFLLFMIVYSAPINSIACYPYVTMVFRSTAMPFLGLSAYKVPVVAAAVLPRRPASRSLSSVSM